MNRARMAAAALAMVLIAQPAGAQGGGFDGQKFVQAVRDRDGNEAMELLRARGTTVLNARDERGDTGLIVAISRRDENWAMFLLAEGADPNFPAKSGDTPLIAAARVGYTGAAEQLLELDVKVDAANRMGETALIVAVQQRHAPIVRLLLAAGADPDRTDSAAGLSARDYARRDTRARDILKLIESAKSKQKADPGPKASSIR
ncbi:MAG TPA: ankyrin repeat domain-containing protein [Sphingomicrobium sp.]|nr:ankyrin repeat domain-containing protein [Sphingomicrobium sp.]